MGHLHVAKLAQEVVVLLEMGVQSGFGGKFYVSTKHYT